MTIYLDVVELLLKLGSDVDSQITFNHCTALTLACLEERDIVVSLLINNNANIEHSTKVYLYNISIIDICLFNWNNKQILLFRMD